MKYITLAVLALCASTSYAQKKTNVKSTVKVVEGPLLKNQIDSVSYAFGMDIGRSLSSMGLKNLDPKIITTAIQTALKGEVALITNAQKEQAIQQEIIKVRQEMENAAKKVETDFFAANASKAGVIAGPQGIQYQVIQEGTGPKPTVADEVEVHYIGTLLDGTEFDNSIKRNTPLSLSLNRVIEGWKLGVPLMSVGSKYRLFIPSKLGYGAQSTGQIPANSVLIFEIELLGIKSTNETT